MVREYINMDDVVAMLPSLLRRLSDRVLLPAEVTCKVVTDEPKDGAKLCSGLERECYDEEGWKFLRNIKSPLLCAQKAQKSKNGW